MLVLFALSACDTAKSDADPEAAALWDEIQGYASWDQSADWTGVKPSCDGTHGPYVQVWYDATGGSLVDGTAAEAEDGATFVKEAYDDDATTVKSVSAMQKRAGFDADNGDWYWAMYDTDGNASQSGSVSGCYGCHESGTDHVRFLSSAVVDSPEDCP